MEVPFRRTGTGRSDERRSGGPVGRSKGNVQFGSIRESPPSHSTSRVSQPTALARNAIPSLRDSFFGLHTKPTIKQAPFTNPRAIDPKLSPSPIPQPAASGGRPPSGLDPFPQKFSFSPGSSYPSAVSTPQSIPEGNDDLAFGSLGRGLRESLESSRKRGRSKRPRSKSSLPATNAIAGNDGGSIARASIREGNYNDTDSLGEPPSKAPITSQGCTEVPLEGNKRICVSYTISEDMSGDRGNKILSRISKKKDNSCEVRLRIRGSCGDGWSLKHRRQAVGDDNGALDRFDGPSFKHGAQDYAVISREEPNSSSAGGEGLHPPSYRSASRNGNNYVDNHRLPKTDHGAPQDEGFINPRELFFTGIPSHFSEQDVVRIFERYGEVEKCQIMLDPKTKVSRGFGTIKMASFQQASAAKKELQGEIFDGKTLSIDMARRSRPRTPAPGSYFGPQKRDDVRATPARPLYLPNSIDRHPSPPPNRHYSPNQTPPPELRPRTPIPPSQSTVEHDVANDFKAFIDPSDLISIANDPKKHRRTSLTARRTGLVSLIPDVITSLPPGLHPDRLKSFSHESPATISPTAALHTDRWKALSPLSSPGDRRSRKREGRSRAATTANGGRPAAAGDMNPASILATLNPALRNQILIEQDEATLAMLPQEIVEQARAAKYNQGLSFNQGRGGFPSQTDSEEAERARRLNPHLRSHLKLDDASKRPAGITSVPQPTEGRGRGGFGPSFQQQPMGFPPPNSQFRNSQNQGRVGMNPPFQGQGQQMPPFPYSHIRHLAALP